MTGHHLCLRMAFCENTICVYFNRTFRKEFASLALGPSDGIISVTRKSTVGSNSNEIAVP